MAYTCKIIRENNDRHKGLRKRIVVDFLYKNVGRKVSKKQIIAFVIGKSEGTRLKSQGWVYRIC